MSKQEINDQLSALVSKEPFEVNKKLVDDLQAAYKAALETSIEEQKKAFVPDEESENAEFAYVESEDDRKYKELLDAYFTKKKALDKQHKEQLQQNFELKKALIEELQSLIQDEENISKAYLRFNAIKQKWNEIGPAPSEKRRDLQAEYSRLIELFYYNINIYRELQNHDLKKNQELKVELIEKIKLLKDEQSIHQLDFLIHKYLDEWDQIGPTFKEEWEKIREQFKESVNEVFDRIREHRKSVKADHEANLAKKKEIISKAIALVEGELSEMKFVQRTTKALIDLQKEWKHIGYSGRKQNDEVWKEFRAICDDFFAKRAEFLKKSNEKFTEIKAKKQALIDRAKEIHVGEDVNMVANELKKLQRDWKGVGKLLPQEEYRMFKQFRGYCDTFFNRKKAEAEQLERELKENLHKKEAFILSLSKQAETELKEKGEELINDWKSKWHAMGDVPEKLRSKVNASFNKIVAKAYQELGISKSEIVEKEFQNRIDHLSNRSDAEAGLAAERRNLQKQIKEAEVAVLMLEDKLAFFKYSDDTNPLKKDLLDKIEDAKNKVGEWRSKRKKIDLMIKGIKQEAAASSQEEEQDSAPEDQA